MTWAGEYRPSSNPHVAAPPPGPHCYSVSTPSMTLTINRILLHSQPHEPESLIYVPSLTRLLLHSDLPLPPRILILTPPLNRSVLHSYRYVLFITTDVGLPAKFDTLAIVSNFLPESLKWVNDIYWHLLSLFTVLSPISAPCACEIASLWSRCLEHVLGFPTVVSDWKSDYFWPSYGHLCKKVAVSIC